MRSNRIRAGILCVLFLLAYCSALYYSDRMRTYSESIYIYNRHMNVSAGMAIDIQNRNDMSEENLTFSFWTEVPGTVIMNKSLNRDTEVAMIETVGRADVLFEQGSALEEFDYGGCIISEDTAHRLFGSKDVVGKNIWHEQKQYTIRGLTKYPEGTMVIQQDENSDNQLTNITLKKIGSQTSGELVSTLRNKYQIAGVVLEYDLINDFVRLGLCIIPIILIVLLTLIQVYSTKYILQSRPCLKHKRVCVQYLCISILFAMGVLLLIIMSDRTFHLFGEYVPAKWSEFGFWGELWEKKCQNLISFIKIPKSGCELSYFYDFCKVTIYYIISLCFLLKIIRKLICFRRLKKGDE